MIQYFDTTLFRAVNRFAGLWFLDSLTDIEENTLLLKGGLFMAVYCWLWFESRGRKQDTKRQTLIAMLMAGFAALFIARALAHVIPFRIRPMYADPLYRHPVYDVTPNMENWSSFPSDTAALFFALAMGVFLIWRAAGALLLAYTTVWICLPRLYLGLHYPSDLIVGAWIGAASACLFWFLARTRLFGRWIGGPLLRLEDRYPPIFYILAFPVVYEAGLMFGDARYALRHAAFLLKLPPSQIAIVWTFLLGFAILVAGLFWKRARSEAGRHPGVTPRADALDARTIEVRFINARR